MKGLCVDPVTQYYSYSYSVTICNPSIKLETPSSTANDPLTCEEYLVLENTSFLDNFGQTLWIPICGLGMFFLMCWWWQWTYLSTFIFSGKGSRNIRKSTKVVTISVAGVPAPPRQLVTAWRCGSDPPPLVTAWGCGADPIVSVIHRCFSSERR